MGEARRPQDLVEAEAEFRKVMEAEPLEVRGPLGLARLMARQGRPAEALTQVFAALSLDPVGSRGQEALLLGATLLDRTGDLNGALTCLQRVRDLWPESPAAATARRRMEVLARHRVLKPALAALGLYPEGRKDWLKTPTLLGVSPAGSLYLYQDDLDQAYRLEGTTLVPVGAPVKGAKAMGFTADGRLILLSPRLGLAMEGQAALLPLSGLGAPSGVAPDGWGGCWVADSRGGALLHVAVDGAQTRLPSPSMVALTVLPGGGLVGASDANRTLLFMDGLGQPRMTVPYGRDLPAGFQQVLALASDGEGHVAALVDGDFEGLVVWGPQGQVLRHATLKALGISGRFRALAMDDQGYLYLADRSGDQIHRLR